MREVIPLSQYTGDRVAIVDSDGNKIFLMKEELIGNKNNYEGAEIHPVKQSSIDSAISDLASNFINEVQDLTSINVDQISKFWQFLREWTKGVAKDNNNSNIYVMLDNVTISIN